MSKSRSGETNGSPAPFGSGRENVQRRAADLFGAQRGRQRVDIDYLAARRVDQFRLGFHARQLGSADHTFGLGRLGHVQRDDVGIGEQFVERCGGTRIAEGQFGFDVVIRNLHANGLGQEADLGPDVAVPDDAELFAADLASAGCSFQPLAAVSRRVPFGNGAHEQNDFGQDQFGHTARIGEGRVEHGDAALASELQIDLVGPDAEASDGDQFGSALQDFGGDLGRRPDAEKVGPTQSRSKRVGGEGFGVRYDVAVAILVKRLTGAGMNALQHDDLDFAFVERRGVHGIFDFRLKPSAAQKAEPRPCLGGGRRRARRHPKVTRSGSR